MRIRQNPPPGADKPLSHANRCQNSSLHDHLLDMALLYSISRTYNGTLQTGELLENTARFLKETMRIAEFRIFLRKRKDGTLRDRTPGAEGLDRERGAGRAAEREIAAMAVRGGEAVLIDDLAKDERFSGGGKENPAGAGAFLAVPVPGGDGQFLGALALRNPEPGAFRDRDRDFFSALAANLGQALERAGRYECALRKSMHDDLTRLYNRRFFQECAEHELNKARRGKGCLSLLLLDLDFFKSVNDRYGHAFGDRVLAKLAEVLRCGLRQSDVAARHGGEEFAVLLPETDAQGARQIAEKLRALVERELVFAVQGKETERITVTIGAASFPEDGASIAELLKIADRRLYTGKHQGRNRVVAPVREQEPTAESRARREERRRHLRYQTALRLVRGSQHIHSIDIGSGDQWSLCTLMDASLDGFHSLVAFEPEIGASYPCRVVNSGGLAGEEFFSVRVRHVEPLADARYLMGVQVENHHGTTWEKFYRSLIH